MRVGKQLCLLGMFLAVLMMGGMASGQYIGDNACGTCHPDVYADYMNTGHPWMLVKTEGADPPMIDYPSGAALPTLPAGTSWTDINYIFGNFNGHGYPINADGNRVTAAGVGGSYSSCVECHTTGYDPAGSTDNIAGTWDDEGIRCEACHGPNANGHDGTQVAMAVDACIGCHYGGEGVDEIDFNPMTLAFGHHPQAEQFIRSAHRSRTCVLCHDVHKSVWLEEEGAVKHCGTDCHRSQKVNGFMGEILDCDDCHMPDGAHIFQITGEPIDALENSYENDGMTYMDVDGDGAAYMTLDQICYRCHTEENLSFEDLVAYAPRIHGGPPVHLELDRGHHTWLDSRDENIVLYANENAKLEVSIDPGDAEGAAAEWYLGALTPWGWYRVDFTRYNPETGPRWVPGLDPSLSNTGVVPIDRFVLLDAPLPAGTYVFVGGIFTHDGQFSHLDYMQVTVLPGSAP